MSVTLMEEMQMMMLVVLLSSRERTNRVDADR
jgi:hypothetical protein